jgi:hypothetical protein
MVPEGDKPIVPKHVMDEEGHHAERMENQYSLDKQDSTNVTEPAKLTLRYEVSIVPDVDEKKKVKERVQEKISHSPHSRKRVRVS